MQSTFLQIYYNTIIFLKKIKTNDDPFFNGYLLITFVQVINLYSVLGLLIKVLDVKITKEGVVISSILLYVSLSIVNYFLLIKRKNKAEKEYLESDVSKRRRSAIISLLYYSVSIVFGILALSIVAKK